MQAYDSIVIKSDVELGGTDQKFNVLRGRELQIREGQDPQIGLFMPILLGTDGEQKMSKSLGNYVGVNESPDVMFHKVYNIADSLVQSWSELLTVKNDFSKDILVAKRELALDIVAQYYGTAAAQTAAEREKAIHSGNELPSDTPEIKLAAGSYGVLDLLVSIGAFASKGEARRMIQNSGVKIDWNIVADVNAQLTVDKEMIVQVGKRKFYRVFT